MLKLDRTKEVLAVTKSDLSGSQFDDVNISGCTFHNVNLAGTTLDDVNCAGWRISNANMSGWRVSDVNLAGTVFSGGRYDGMTIDGVAVTDLLALWRAHQPAEPADPAAGPLPE